MTDEESGASPARTSPDGSEATSRSAADGGGDDAADDSTGAGPPGGRTGADAPDGRPPDDTPGGRTVEIPLQAYKAVTVFSTLFAVVGVVGGFVLLDEATRRATAAPEDVNVFLALLGLGTIALGAGTYAFSTRFRARGMGKPKDGADQPSDDG